MGIGAALSGIATFLGSGTAAAAIAATALRIGAAVAISGLLQRKPSAPGVQARTLTTRGTVDPEQLIYGEALVGGSLAYRNAHGNNNSQLWAVHCLAGHECESILDVHLDGNVIANSIINGGAAGGGGVSSGTYAPTRGSVNTVEIWKHLGLDTQAADTNLTAASSDWTSAHRLRGITNAVTMFKLNDRTEQVWEGGDPSNVLFLVRGKKVYDPRLDTTPGANPDNASYIAWSDNPALCLADFLRDDKFSAFPGGIAASRIDWDAVVTAADACDVLVAIPTSSTEKRFTCNGVLYGTASPEENVAAILSSMNGALIFTGGMYVIKAGVYEAPVDSLSEDDIIGPVGITSALDSDQRVNTMKAIYIDRDKLYEPTETAEIAPSAYLTTRDGGERLPQSIDLPMTDSNTMAQRICLKRLHAANEELTITVPCNLRAARLVPGERVNLTITERGWTPKVFKVLDWELKDTGDDQLGIDVLLQEDSSAAYADPLEGGYNTISAGGVLTLADPEIPPGRDTIPRGITYGGGVWNINIQENMHSTGANDGEILLSRGVFVLPDGSVRELGDEVDVSGPFEGSLNPPDGTFYVVWGATDLDVRFPHVPDYVFGDNTSGIFNAIYDRFNDQWYAVDNSNEEIEFTPASTDIIIARGLKNIASGGIEQLTSLVSVGNVPRSSQAPLDGPRLQNPNFETPMLGAPHRPSAWWIANSSNTSALAYEAGALNVAEFASNFAIVGTAFRVDPTKEYRVNVRAKGSQTMNNSLDVHIGEYNSELDIAGGEYSLSDTGAREAPGPAWDNLVATGILNEDLTTSFQTFTGEWTPGSSALWAVVRIYGSNVTGNVLPDMVTVDELEPIRIIFDPPSFSWDTYEAGGWSPADTTQTITARAMRGTEEVGTLALNATLDNAGANEGDVAVVAGTNTGDAMTASISTNNSPSVSIRVTHTDSGYQSPGSAYFGSALPGYSGGVSK